MAKQVGPLFFTGTIDGIIFYKIGDQYYMRSKGSYKSAKHMRRNPKYKRTMENADRFGGASKLVGEVYYTHLPKSMRKRGVYGQLTGLVNGWLHEGKSKAETLALLIAHCQTFATAQPKTTAPKTSWVSNNEQRLTSIVPSTTVHKQPSTLNDKPKPKQARYLSRWKVKRNGRLHIPKMKKPLLETEVMTDGKKKKQTAFYPPD